MTKFWDRVITLVMLIAFNFMLASPAHVSGFDLCCLGATLLQTCSRIGWIDHVGWQVLPAVVVSLCVYCMNGSFNGTYLLSMAAPQEWVDDPSFRVPASLLTSKMFLATHFYRLSHNPRQIVIFS